VIVYVETNFLLEHAQRQEQSASCEWLLVAAEAGRVRLVVPAYSLVEARTAMRLRRERRLRLKADLDRELRQLGRAAHHAPRIDELRDITARLVESAEHDAEGLRETTDRVARSAEIVALDGAMLSLAREFELVHGLRADDAVVYAGVRSHLRARSDVATPSCFLNRNSKDFEDPDISGDLAELGCRLISQFDDGRSYVESALTV
jgi:predicted nucleic acid-binding protein